MRQRVAVVLGGRIAALLLGGMCLGTAAHAAHPGHIVGSIAGASGPTARHVPTGVAVIDGSTSEIGAAGRAHGPWRFRLAIPPGVYHVLVSIVQRSDTLSGLSPLLAVTAGHTTDTEIGIAADVSPAVAAAIAVQPETAISGGVATMGDVIVQNPAGFPPANLGQLFLTPLFNRTRDRCKLRWVDRTRRFLDAHAREVQLQRDGRLDPSTPVRDALVLPTLQVEGTFVNDLRTTSGELRLVDIRTGRVLLRRRFSGPTRDLDRLIERWGDGFGTAMCPAVRRTTRITTTTSPVTTTSTTTTNPASGIPCSQSSQCGANACCNPVGHFCCDWVHTNSDACSGGGAIFGTSLGCGYNQNGTTPYNGKPCGQVMPAVCPPEAYTPIVFECSMCADDMKYVSRFCDVTANPAQCSPGTTGCAQDSDCPVPQRCLSGSCCLGSGAPCSVLCCSGCNGNVCN